MFAKGEFDVDQIVERLGSIEDPLDRWQALTSSLSAFGIDQFNYGYLDMETASRMEARVDPVSTMRPDWIAHYTAKGYDLADYALAHVRKGSAQPMLWSVEHAKDQASGHVILEANEAGLRTGLFVPLAGMDSSGLPGAAIMFGSGLDEAEFLKLLGSQSSALVALAHLFHAGASGELLRRKDRTPNLTPRERDCLRLLAAGMRPDAIADRLCLASVTVGMHLRHARLKLGTRTMPEAVARALLYQQI